MTGWRPQWYRFDIVYRICYIELYDSFCQIVCDMTINDFALACAVDESGRVLKAEPVPRRTPVSASLIGAARNAALLWRFEPAKRGGQPVQSEMILKLSSHS